MHIMHTGYEIGIIIESVMRPQTLIVVTSELQNLFVKRIFDVEQLF